MNIFIFSQKYVMGTHLNCLRDVCMCVCVRVGGCRGGGGGVNFFSSSEKGSTLLGKEFALLGSNCFFL